MIALPLQFVNTAIDFNDEKLKKFSFKYNYRLILVKIMYQISKRLKIRIKKIISRNYIYDKILNTKLPLFDIC